MAIPVLWIPGCFITQSDDFMHLVFPSNKSFNSLHHKNAF